MKARNWCKEHNIIMYSTKSGLKSVFVERFNRTMKESFYKMFSNHQTKNYLNFLPKFIDEYNNTVHSATYATPDSLYNHDGISHEIIKMQTTNKSSKFKLDDFVRISKVKNTFEKGYTDRWSREAFKIKAIDETSNPPMYQLEDLKGEPIVGLFYPQELQITLVPYFKIIDKVISRKKEGKVKMVYVSYDGWDNKFNEWITDVEYKKQKGKT